jgi:D-xylose 1-dehydrogenase
MTAHPPAALLPSQLRMPLRLGSAHAAAMLEAANTQEPTARCLPFTPTSPADPFSSQAAELASAQPSSRRSHARRRKPPSSTSRPGRPGLRGEGLDVRFTRADLTDTAQLQAAVADIAAAQGPVSVLVNNAAHDERHDTLAVTPEYFDARIAVNLKHVFFAAQAVLPGMQAAGGGSIINFSSISWMAGMGGMPVYTAAKSAMLGLTRALARDFGVSNIRVNAIAPGWIRTERQEQLWITPEGERQMLAAQCLKRWLKPEEVARLALFLASEEASACTAQHYVVDGGWV